MTEQTDAAEYTPTTQEVRSAYVMARYETEGVNNPQLYAEFARWLAAREAAARAEERERVAVAIEAEVRSWPCYSEPRSGIPMLDMERDLAAEELARIARTDGAGS